MTKRAYIFLSILLAILSIIIYKEFKARMFIKPTEAMILSHYDEAIDGFNSYLKIWPGDNLAHFYLGDVFDKQGHPEKALAEWKRSEELDPSGWMAHVRLSGYYLKNKMFDEALKEAQLADAVNPGGSMSLLAPRVMRAMDKANNN